VVKDKVPKPKGEWKSKEIRRVENLLATSSEEGEGQRKGTKKKKMSEKCSNRQHRTTRSAFIDSLLGSGRLISKKNITEEGHPRNERSQEKNQRRWGGGGELTHQVKMESRFLKTVCNRKPSRKKRQKQPFNANNPKS